MYLYTKHIMVTGSQGHHKIPGLIAHRIVNVLPLQLLTCRVSVIFLPLGKFFYVRTFTKSITTQ